MISLFETSDSTRDAGILTPSSGADRALSLVTVKNEFVRCVYRDISSWYDYFFGPTLHGARLAAMPRLPIGSGDKILEVGVGTGINALLYPKHCDVTGIDFSSSMLSLVLKKITLG